MTDAQSPDEISQSELLEREAWLADASIMFDAEAGELGERRPHPDGHLYEVEGGLRHHAAEIEAYLRGDR